MSLYGWMNTPSAGGKMFIVEVDMATFAKQAKVKQIILEREREREREGFKICQ